MATNQSTTLAEQKMTDGSVKLKLVSPFVPGFSDKARALGGTWNPTRKAWYFDTRDAARVRALCLETFGVDPLADPNEAPELVTVRFDFGPTNYNVRRSSALWLFGREIAQRPGRDNKVRLGNGVVILSGGFSSHGGSAKYPALDADETIVLEIRDVPAALVAAEQAKYPAGTITIIESTPAADRVPPTIEQIIALAKTLSAEQRTTVVAQIQALA